MSSRQRMTIFTSSANSPGSSNPASPVNKPPVTYRVEERTRTIYVQSSQPPSQWNPQDLHSLFEKHNVAAEPIARVKSKIQTDYIVAQDNAVSSGRKSLSAPASLAPPSRRSNPPSPNRSPRGPRPKILFYHKHDPHYGFTNFSPHSVTYNGKVYPTSEHLFQSFKFQGHHDDLAEHIRLFSQYPSAAFSEARRFQEHVRPDWKKVNISRMDEVLYHKFTQHNDLRAELLATGDAELVEDSDKDSFWGIGADGKGFNELGKGLERLRSRLRKEGWH
ncbi:hypothetical protein AGABI2DRAFT_191527 [Agaricus bisporus var. bisporus H97]|uniref:hypothetical protein n=1 Tax=Agaricus bisporus var. bisporus (strain H97 / ATCC MYA-4626 / FGSC 10389) TaxID=936046 RepID=UPI00029F660B|nr:hypothetical protein AGABI2DRAFT_191527 [Agaricus bisporus var. bisporus H97]EKV49548.1 hypothetical protein AGABI2DRAFT_191527 [Agaricus bisporus var. bisporus H97]